MIGKKEIFLVLLNCFLYVYCVDREMKGSDKTGVVAGASVGGICLLLAALVVLIFIRRRRRKRKGFERQNGIYNDLTESNKVTSKQSAIGNKLYLNPSNSADDIISMELKPNTDLNDKEPCKNKSNPLNGAYEFAVDVDINKDNEDASSSKIVENYNYIDIPDKSYATFAGENMVVSEQTSETAIRDTYSHIGNQKKTNTIIKTSSKTDTYAHIGRLKTADSETERSHLQLQNSVVYDKTGNTRKEEMNETYSYFKDQDDVYNTTKSEQATTAPDTEGNYSHLKLKPE